MTAETGKQATHMLLVTVPEWGHLSPFLHMASSIQSNWDSSRGTLQLTLASMEQVGGWDLGYRPSCMP